MRLSSLEAHTSFALLGPGYGGAPELWLDLHEGRGGSELVYAAFEARVPRRFVAASAGDFPDRPPNPTVEATKVSIAGVVLPAIDLAPA